MAFAVQNERHQGKHGTFKSIQAAIPSANRLIMFLDQNTAPKDSNVRNSAPEVFHLGLLSSHRICKQRGEHGYRKHNRRPGLPYCKIEQWKNKRDPHLVNERPECEVVLTRMVIAQQQNMLKNQRRTYRLRPGLTRPPAETGRIVP